MHLTVTIISPFKWQLLWYPPCLYKLISYCWLYKLYIYTYHHGSLSTYSMYIPLHLHYISTTSPLHTYQNPIVPSSYLHTVIIQFYAVIIVNDIYIYTYTCIDVGIHGCLWKYDTPNFDAKCCHFLWSEWPPFAGMMYRYLYIYIYLFISYCSTTNSPWIPCCWWWLFMLNAYVQRMYVCMFVSVCLPVCLSVCVQTHPNIILLATYLTNMQMTSHSYPICTYVCT